MLGLLVLIKQKNLVNNGTINFDLTDTNGQSIKDYVDEMNTKIAEELMTMEVPVTTVEPPQIYPGPQTNPVIDRQRNEPRSICCTNIRCYD